MDARDVMDAWDVLDAQDVPNGVHLPHHSPYPTPPFRPFHPPSLLTILTAERDGKKYLEIQPSEIEKVTYNKTNR